MSKITNTVALAALAIFTEHKNIDKIFMTSDCQGFTDEEKAKDRARYLKDDNIYPFERGFEDSYQEEEETLEKSKGDDPAEREALMTEYEELFGKPANHMTGVPKLKERISAKKAELAAAAKQPLSPAVEVNKTEGTSDLETSKDQVKESEQTKDSAQVQE